MVYHAPARRASLDTTFGALADPTRRAMLARLARGEKTISELAARFDMSLPAVSKHVRVLERAGLARVRRDGRVRRTTLVATPLREAAVWLERYGKFWGHQLDMLAAYLETATDTNLDEPAWTESKDDPKSRSKSGASSRRRGNASSRRGRAQKKSGGGSRRDR